jgi:hypothetical protein
MQKIWPRDHDTPKCGQDPQVAVVNSISSQPTIQNLAQGLTSINTLPEPVIIERTWHYHYFGSAGDQRHVRCIWPGCDVVMPTCAHSYQNYGPSYKCCPTCQEMRRVETGGLFGKALVQQPIGGDVEEDKEW